MWLVAALPGVALFFGGLWEGGLRALLAADGAEVASESSGISFVPHPEYGDNMYYRSYSYRVAGREYENKVGITTEESDRRGAIMIRYSRRFPWLSRPPGASNHTVVGILMFIVGGFLLSAPGLVVAWAWLWRGDLNAIAEFLPRRWR